MNKYAKAAIEAVKLLEDDTCSNSMEAWEQSTSNLFGQGTHSQVKGCPRGAFLGLCEEGLVNGVKPGNYCKSIKNKAYAVNAVKLLKKNPELAVNKSKLWYKSVGEPKAHSSQMDIVIALWEKGLIDF